jgi:hypothetical protein
MNIRIVGGILMCQTDEIHDVWAPLNADQLFIVEDAVAKSKQLIELY